MLKKTITYVDFDGNERSKDCYFNLTRTELLEMDMDSKGGMEKWINKIIAERDNKEIYRTFKTMILAAYGEKSLDGDRFIKSEELSIAFSQTPAFDELIIGLLSDEEAAAAFVNGIIPKNVKEAAEKANITPLPKSE